LEIFDPHAVVKYLVAGTRLETDEERTAWKERGIWRVLDGNNDNTSTPPAVHPLRLRA
jgi:hypothetical protein